MKKILMIMALTVPGMLMQAQQVADLHVTDAVISRVEDNMDVAMTVKPSDYKLKTNTQWRVTPMLYSIDLTDSIALPSFLITGKNAWYYAQRQGLDSDGTSLLRSGKGDDLAYAASTPYQSWMEHSVLKLQARKVSCCGESPKDVTDNYPVAEINLEPERFQAAFNYVTPVKQERKDRNMHGRAYVNFIVNKTNIVPTYMNNTVELRKILNSIDSVRLNADATVDTILLTGYASPEGPWNNNVRLAKGRTEAVKEYVKRLYDFPASVYRTNSVPEDWEGLREYIAGSNLANRDAMLAFIDNEANPVQTRNDRFRARFPQQYQFLLKNEYPWLRHTDYYIHYVIKQYTTVDEIREAYKRDPRNLSLNEFFILAQTYPANSNEYCDMLVQAAAIYQNEPEANLNAANASMARGEYAAAGRYLAKAGSSAEADYARGVLAALTQDYDNALTLFGNAANAGVDRAADAARQINDMMQCNGTVRYLSGDKE
ncbi:MAG: DUF3868 domain-containing protein [Muribaculum sp.]|nr:DUF3868 domain-containing protein [Muribaculum sp.]